MDSMHNGHDNADALVRELRDEVRRRKQELGSQQPETKPAALIQPEAVAATSSLAPVAPPPAPQQVEPLKPLQGARGAIDRARSKSAGASGWPRFLRGLRRNQTAVNESVIRALSSVVDAVERLRQKFALLDGRVRDQTVSQENQLARLKQDLEQGRKEQAAHEQHIKQIHAWQGVYDQQVQEINTWRKALEHERKQIHAWQRVSDQQVQEINTWRKALEHERQKSGAEQQERWQEVERRRAELAAHFERRFTEQIMTARNQEERLLAQTRLVEEQQRHLLELSHKLIASQTDIGARFERTTAEQLTDRKQLLEIQSLIREQEKQTVEERRQIGELARKLAEQQEKADARWQKRAEQRQDDGRQLFNLQEFVNAQQRQNAEYGRLLEEQQRQLTQVHEEQQDQLALVRDKAEAALRGGTDAARLLAEHAELLRQAQEFIAAQQNQTAAEQQQFEEFNGKITECQNDVCARYHLTDEHLLATKTQLEQTQKQLAEIQNFVNEQEKQTGHEGRLLREQQEVLSQFRAEFEQWRDNRLSSANLEGQLDSLRNRINAAHASFAIIQSYLAKAGSAEELKATAPSLSEELKKHEADAFYLAFENEFRGDRAEIKQRLRFYLPIIEETKAKTRAASAVDLGCGRGEWLELLREHDYEAQGVDLNVCMVEECHSRGLKAHVADAIAYLRALPTASISLVTGFHIVEHLPFTDLLELFREAFRVLLPQGTAIFETPNPECPHVPSYSFYLDPTHRNPIPQELLCFCASQAGFGATRVERLQPHFEQNEFKGYLDYAGIFTK
jgi:ubiquinone/menaquinone biosynthesis C-methylase UbiE